MITIFLGGTRAKVKKIVTGAKAIMRTDGSSFIAGGFITSRSKHRIVPIYANNILPPLGRGSVL